MHLDRLYVTARRGAQGGAEDSKRKHIFTILSRAGFLFNFSAMARWMSAFGLGSSRETSTCPRECLQMLLVRRCRLPFHRLFLDLSTICSLAIHGTLPEKWKNWQDYLLTKSPMPAPSILSYADVLTKAGNPRHLLLGNGFSISCRPDLFRYHKLFDRADFSSLKRAREAFDRLSTTNFEAVIRALRDFALICDLYAPGDGKAKTRASADADALREVLVSAVADSHPDRPHNIESDEYLNCRAFVRGYTEHQHPQL